MLHGRPSSSKTTFLVASNLPTALLSAWLPGCLSVCLAAWLPLCKIITLLRCCGLIDRKARLVQWHHSTAASLPGHISSVGRQHSLLAALLQPQLGESLLHSPVSRCEQGKL